MKVFCLYVPAQARSRSMGRECAQGAKKFGVTVELVPAVHWRNLDAIHGALNLKRRWQPHFKRTTTPTHCPAFRLANGTSHYLLYRRCVELGEPVVILEHDARFIRPLPGDLPPFVTQLAWNGPLTNERLAECQRVKRTGETPNRLPPFEGIIPHPLDGLNGTAGYWLPPWAAQRLVDFIHAEGIGYADRVTRSVVGPLFAVAPPPLTIHKHFVQWYGRK